MWAVLVCPCMGFYEVPVRLIWGLWVVDQEELDVSCLCIQLKTSFPLLLSAGYLEGDVSVHLTLQFTRNDRFTENRIRLLCAEVSCYVLYTFSVAWLRFPVGVNSSLNLPENFVTFLFMINFTPPDFFRSCDNQSQV